MKFTKRIHIPLFFSLSFIFGIFLASFILPLENIWEIRGLGYIKILLHETAASTTFYLIILLFLFILLQIEIPAQKRRFLFKAALVTTFVFLGINQFLQSELDPIRPENINHYNNQEVSVHGTVIKVTPKANSTQLILVPEKLSDKTEEEENPTNLKFNGKILIITDKNSHLIPGDKININDQLKEIEEFIPTFSYKDYLHKDNIYSQFLFPKITDLGANSKLRYKILPKTYLLKQALKRNIEKYVPDIKSQAFLNAFLLGDKKELSDEMVQNFAQSGLSHIMAISGLHIGMLSLGIYFLLLNIFKFPKKTVLIVTPFVLILYLVIIGFPASATRAVIMSSLIMLAIYKGRHINFLNCLFIAAAVILWFKPRYLKYDLGFQLSFLALLGIFYLYPLLEKQYLKIKKYFYERKKQLPSINQHKRPFNPKISNTLKIIFVSVSAQLGTLPLVASKFGLISFIAPISNIIILPFLPIVYFLGMATVLIPFISPSLASISGIFLSFSLELSLRLIEILANIPGSYLQI